MNDKLKFYRSTLVQMTKEAYRKMPRELKTEEAVEEAELLTKAIMKQVDEYENSFNYQTQVNENSKVNYHFGGDNCVAKDFTCTDPNFFKGVNPDYLKTEPIRTIVDNGQQYQSNQKSYGTLGEHWKELSELFYIKSNFEHWEKLFNDVIIPDLKLYGHVCPRTEFNIYYYKRVDDVYNSLGIEFIEDFVKACEKCEE